MLSDVQVSSTDVSAENALSLLQSEIAQAPASALETAYAIGQALMDAQDGGKLLLGDVLSLLTPAYGRSVIWDFAKNVGLGRSTAYEYLQVATFYPRDRRDEVTALATIRYSHLRLAMRFGDYDSALHWLTHVADAGMTVDEAKRDIARLTSPSERVVLVADIADLSRGVILLATDEDTSALEYGRYRVTFVKETV